MAQEQEQVVSQQEASDDANQSTTETQTTEVDVADVEAKIAELQSQLAKQQEIVEKARKGEKYHKTKAEAEVKKVQSLYEQEKARADSLEQKIRNNAADVLLRQSLSEHGAKAVDTALKLIDRAAIKFDAQGAVVAESVSAAVEALKQSDSILFGEAEPKKPAPPVARATETDRISGELAEIQAAKTNDELMAVLRKYGKA